MYLEGIASTNQNYPQTINKFILEIIIDKKTIRTTNKIGLFDEEANTVSRLSINLKRLH